MRVLIIEDEAHAAAQLMTLLRTLPGSFDFVDVIDNTEDAVAFLSTKPPIDLIFLDIYLADGVSFTIFKQVRTDVPIIFTTAYDQYAIQAFDVNSIDYLLKPIRLEQLQKALEKYARLTDRQQGLLDTRVLAELSRLIQGEKTYKRHFLVPFKDRLIPVAADEFAWFEVRYEVVRGMKFDQVPLVMEEKSLEELSAVLHPAQFYRANRQFLINRKAIREISYYFNGRLYLNLEPAPAEKILISKARANQFKTWMRTAVP
ncbi:LytTR family DNA-binding domain-containing protein [Larkinella knui]|uniref:DNA-binding response regulator n=1 Tax=Larkinella knui TaxID=2025310 RepID=A0A3P1CN82_9BACT|nr:LytTR family DNA-binding domain-containing protein [Larkinella knui]RRB14791.1 DNA-binding response regulator [Larkinella knui]